MLTRIEGDIRREIAKLGGNRQLEHIVQYLTENME